MRVAVNQAVIRIYVLLAVGALAMVFAVWPRRKSGPARGEAFIRFFVGFALGGAVVLFGFHNPGQVRGLVMGPNHALVLERHEGRLWGEEDWTRLDLDTGRPRRSTAPDERGEVAVRTSSSAMEAPRTLRGRLLRYEGGEPVPMGPVLGQPVLAFGAPDFAVVAAYEELSRPATVYLARYERDGSLGWRLEASELGLRSGRLRRSAPVGDGDLLVVFSGVWADRGWLGTFTQDEHVLAARIHLADGTVRWRRAF